MLASTLIILSFTNSLLITAAPQTPSHTPECSASYEYWTNKSLFFQIQLEILLKLVTVIFQ